MLHSAYCSKNRVASAVAAGAGSRKTMQSTTSSTKLFIFKMKIQGKLNSKDIFKVQRS